MSGEEPAGPDQSLPISSCESPAVVGSSTVKVNSEPPEPPPERKPSAHVSLLVLFYIISSLILPGNLSSVP